MQSDYMVQILLPGDCRLWPKPVFEVSELTFRKLSAGDGACLYYFRAYLKGTVCQGYCQFIWFLTCLKGTVRWWIQLVCFFLNLPAVDCCLEEQLVFFYFFATFLQDNCLPGVGPVYTVLGTYLKGPVHLWCSLCL